MVFDFDEWATLYRTDPEEFERRRKAVTTAAIEAAPVAVQPKLAQLQWKLDAIHQTTTPMDGLFKMQTMMWNSFFMLHTPLIRLACGLSPEPPRPTLKRVK